MFGLHTCLVFAITKTIFVVPRRFEAVFIDVTVSVNDASTRLGIHAQLDSVIARQFQTDQIDTMIRLGIVGPHASNIQIRLARLKQVQTWQRLSK